jgi:hypothetical protein
MGLTTTLTTIGGYSQLTVVVCLANGFTPPVGQRW